MRSQRISSQRIFPVGISKIYRSTTSETLIYGYHHTEGAKRPVWCNSTAYKSASEMLIGTCYSPKHR